MTIKRGPHAPTAPAALSCRRRFFGVALAMLAMVSVVVPSGTFPIGGQPAGATHAVVSPCVKPANQTEFTNNACRENLADPGIGRLLTRAEILTPARRALYAGLDFSEQWLWYAPDGTVSSSELASADKWTYCETHGEDDSANFYTGAGFTCPDVPGQTIEEFGVLDSFAPGANFTLDVWEYKGAWISKACGNTFGTPSRDPIPKIRIEKYHDLDGDGDRASSEPAPPVNFRFRIVRTSSLVGQSTGPIATVTAAAGTATFALNGHGPGTYQLQEIPKTGWTQTEPVGGGVRTVNVPFGAGDRTYTRVFGNVQIADPEKVDFELIDPPTELEVLTDTELTVRSTITNNGPGGPVTVRETLVVTGPTDCTIATNPRERLHARSR